MGMGKKWKKKQPVPPRLVAVFVVVLLVIVYLRRPASEASLLQHFNRNQEDFVELRSMLATNVPATLLEGSEEIPGWSLEDYERYQALLRRTGVSMILQEGADVRFQLAGALGPGKGERIAVAWTEAQADPVVSSLREFRKKHREQDHAYLALTNNWYLWIGR
jgi:hypothetical protein